MVDDLKYVAKGGEIMAGQPVDKEYGAVREACKQAKSWFQDHGYGDVVTTSKKVHGSWHVEVHAGILPKELHGYPRRFGDYPWRFFQNGVRQHLIHEKHNPAA